MGRPKIKDYIEHRGDTPIGLYGQAENYVDALEEFIDHQAPEIKSLKEQLKKSRSINAELKHQLVKIDTGYKEQLEKERYENQNTESVIDNCLNELSNWNNIDGYNTQKALEYIQTQLTQNQTKDETN